MKKLIIAIGAVCASLALNAASCSWAVSGVCTPETTTAASGYVAYFFLTESTVTDYVTVNQDSVIASILDGSFASEYASKAFASKTTANGSLSATGLAGKFGAGDKATGFSVILDAGTFAEAQHYIATSTITQTYTSATGSKPFAYTKVNDNYQWAEIGTVPEPTSGLLLLIGMAGLALKRKQA